MVDSRVVPECFCLRCKYNCEKLYCTRRDSTSALPIELKGIPSSRVSTKRLVRTNTCDIFPLHEESRPRDWRFSRTFASLTRNIFATLRNTESTLERYCLRCKYNCEKLYCTFRYSNSGPLVTRPVLYRLS